MSSHNVEIQHCSDILVIGMCPYVSTVSSINSEMGGIWQETLTIEVQVLSICLLLENLMGNQQITKQCSPHLNSGPPNYDAGTILIQQQHPILK